MTEILTWFTAVLAIIVLIQAIWVTLLTVKANKRRKKAWRKKNTLNSLALLISPAFLPAMWALCGVLFIEMLLLTYVLIDFYVADSAARVRIPAVSLREQP